MARRPAAGLPPPGEAPGRFAVLPLTAAADPALPALRQALAGRGWGLALDGLEAAALALVEPAGLPADLILLRWSPALEDRASLAALRAMPPDRLVLTGATARRRWTARRPGAGWPGVMRRPPGGAEAAA